MRRTMVTVAVLAAVLLAGAPAAAARAAAGSAGVGDPYYPDYGNGGYDVSHYDIRLRYNPATDELSGTTTILATATQDLTSFDLDFVLAASAVRVNGYAASFARTGDHELVVTAPRRVTKGQRLTVVVQYAGIPSQVQAAGFTAWTRIPGGALAIGEPEIAWWWFPSNDHPLDKATFDISVLVPNGTEVISNGVQVGNPRPELVGWSRWFWRSGKPMATYLAFLTIGQFEITRDVAANGRPVLNAYSELLGDLAEPAKASIERTAEIVDWESGILGEYPFEAEGGVVVPSRTLGYALEDQTRPVYDAAFFTRGADPYVVVHENAHQWFGDSVSVHHWQDIWLNEGFATYLEWLWSDATGEGTPQEQFDFNYQYYYNQAAFWQVKVGDPGVAKLFDDAVYYRGAMALQQLRLAVGDTAFFTILRKWVQQRQYGNGTIAQFTALAERVSGRNLGALFDTWLYRPTRPEVPGSAPSAGATERSAATVRTAMAEPRSWAKIRAANERKPATR